MLVAVILQECSACPPRVTRVSGRAPNRASLATLARAPILVASAASFLVSSRSRPGTATTETSCISSSRDAGLAWGYVDQPPITPAIARLADELSSGSRLMLRAFPALFSAVTVILTALCARELGAGRLGQTVTAIAVAASTGVLLVGHMLSTSTLDVTLWVAITLVVLRILRTGETRAWLLVGALVGVALLNKWTVGFLVAGLFVGILVGRERRLLMSPWLIAGAAIALAMWTPNLLWQADRGWPQLEVFGAIQERSADPGATALWVPLQFAMSGWLAAPLWIAGLFRLVRSEDGRPWRALGIAYVALAVPLAIVAGDKPYYVAALYLPLAAAGAVPFERWWQRNRGKARRILIPPLLGALTVVSLPVALPILPPSTLTDVPVHEANEELGEQIGWPTFARQVTEVWRAIPEGERSHAIVFTGSYGEAAALERFAPDLPARTQHLLVVAHAAT